ncbi:uncharacterized protein [Ambystoma mexicanum]|uniref:uncharacterized protein n=1 Tax=Ambystoma mexicanum TaxID=8296 RepID=UPI0037E9340D
MKRLQTLLGRLENAGLTIHRDKCEFLRPEITYLGYKFGSTGISPDPQKVADIQAASPPLTPTEVRSFLGMATYCGRFIRNLATLSEPLRNLTKANTKWDWGQKCQQAFESIKESLSVDSKMA